MRSNLETNTKVAKPPPPIPPRPNKTLVAEALAKTRAAIRPVPDDSPRPPLQYVNSNNNNGFLPVAKSQSHTTINNKVISKVQRSSSNACEKKKNSTRPVIFQSANVKTSVAVSRVAGDAVQKTQKSSDVVLINLDLENGKECNRVNRNNSLNQCNNEKNHVNSLIDEMFASILDIPDGEGDDANVELPEAFNENVIISQQNESLLRTSTSLNNVKTSNESLNETENDAKKRLFVADKRNHEFLISELENMHKEAKIHRQKRPPPLDFSDDRIHRSDWVEVNNGQEVRLSRCEIIIDDCDKDVDVTTDRILSRLNMSSYGLPPLPKSLSGFNLNPQTPNRVTPPSSGFSPGGHAVYSSHPRLSNGGTAESPGRTPTNLDNQLAILRREMYSLRQLDLSLLSQLWSLNESIQEFRQMLQEQDDRGLSPPSPSPSPSSCDDGETDEFFSPSPMKLRPAPPPPPLRRTSNSSSANSSEYSTV